MRVKDDPLTSQADLARKTAESIRVEAEAAYAAVIECVLLVEESKLTADEAKVDSERNHQAVSEVSTPTAESQSPNTANEGNQVVQRNADGADAINENVLTAKGASIPSSARLLGAVQTVNITSQRLRALADAADAAESLLRNHVASTNAHKQQVQDTDAGSALAFAAIGQAMGEIDEQIADLAANPAAIAALTTEFQGPSDNKSEPIKQQADADLRASNELCAPLPAGSPPPLHASSTILLAAVKLQRAARKAQGRRAASEATSSPTPRFSAAFSPSPSKVDQFFVLSMGAGVHTPSAIAQVFNRFDWDGSGDLDVFELSSAVKALWGQAPSPAQVLAMVRETGALKTNTLSLAQFASIFEKKWATLEDVHGDFFSSLILDSGENAVPGDWYTLDFLDSNLGFGVSLDAIRNRIVVRMVEPPLHGKVNVGDGILAVNGSPMGLVKHPAALQEKVKVLTRPLTITFVRKSRSIREVSSNIIFDEVVKPKEESQSLDKACLQNDVKIEDTKPAISETLTSDSKFEKHGSEIISSTFEKFDLDNSGDLDMFELSNAVAELWGHAPTMAQLSAIVHEVGVHESHKLSLKQFSDIFTREWPTSADESSGPVLSSSVAKIGDTFEEEFGGGSLGFGVLLDVVNCRIVVSTVSTKLDGKVQVGDGVLAVNGVPLGRAFHPGILQLRLKPLRRPLTLTFVRLGESAVEGLFDKPAELEPTKTLTTPGGPTPLDAAAIEEVFYRFDTDFSGDLDTFELSNAVAELWGRPPNTAQVTAMVHDTGALETNTLTLQQFTDVLAKDWSSLNDNKAVPKVTGRDAQPGEVFECAFPHAVLGFGVYFDEPHSRILVSLVSDALVGVLEVGDIALAVNGAPLGKVNRPSALQEAIKLLTRPLNISFKRRELSVQGTQNGEDLPEVKASSHLNEQDSAMVADVFRRFDWDASGDLDTFELSSAVAELWGHAPSTAQVAAMVRWVGAHESNSVTLPQFEVLLTQDWSNESHQVESLCGGETAMSGTLYEESFGAGPLGFGVIWDADRSRVVVSLLSTELMGKIEMGDGILAVNGAPLGKVNSPLALAEAIKTLRRPLTITFVRHGAEDEAVDESAPTSTTGFKLLRRMSQEATTKEGEAADAKAPDTTEATRCDVPSDAVAVSSLESTNEMNAVPFTPSYEMTVVTEESKPALVENTLLSAADEPNSVSILEAPSTVDVFSLHESLVPLEENDSPMETSPAVDTSPPMSELEAASETTTTVAAAVPPERKMDARESNTIATVGKVTASEATDRVKVDDTKLDNSGEEVVGTSSTTAVEAVTVPRCNPETTSELSTVTTRSTSTALAAPPVTPLKASTATNELPTSMSSTPASRSAPLFSTPMAASACGTGALSSSAPLKKLSASKVRANARAMLLEGAKNPANDVSTQVPMSPLVKMRSRNF